MTHIPAIEPNRALNAKGATYNAVKIQVNDPQTNIPEGHKSSSEDNGIYNAVSIEVNRPSVNADKHQHRIYDYPDATCPICADMAGFHPVNLPQLPVTYQTTNFINNRTLINAEVDVDKESAKTIKENKPVSAPEAQVVIVEEFVKIPEPNVTTTEEQKAPSEVSFNGINFRANESKPTMEIIPPNEIKPEVDIQKIVANLSDKDFDIQAKQMEEIARVSMEDSAKAVPFIVTEIFSELINIVKKDTSNLTPPSEKQIEIRKQIIVNEIIKEQALAEKKDASKIELPYKISEQELAEASDLSTLEQAERNKEYALYTMAILSKVYTDEVHKQTGNIVPLTDLPGVSEIVDSLRYNTNSGVKIAAIDALRYINRPEYKEELTAVLELAADDRNPYVARNAAMALENLD